MNQATPHTNIGSCDLSTVIGLWQRQEGPRCAGFAKSQNRGCFNPINVENVRKARELLGKGTKILKSAESGELELMNEITKILEDLAPIVLCKKLHRDQATGLVNTWTGLVRQFVQERRRRIAAMQPFKNEERARTRARESTPNTAGDTWIQVNQQNNYTLNIINIGSMHVGLPKTTNVRQNNYVSSRTAMASPNARPRPASNTQPSTRSLPELDETVRTTRRVSSPSSAVLPRLPPPPRAATVVRRRPLEGNCEICYEPLHDALREDELQEDSTEEDGDLVWCRMQCGHNFHKVCMDHWIECCTHNSRPATCPMCRAVWRT